MLAQDNVCFRHEVQLETACITSQGKIEALGRRLQTIEDLRIAVTQLMGAGEPTRFTAMQQKYAAAQLTPSEPFSTVCE